MKWSNVKLIYLRELRDQLRDRRTMFTIAVLPLLLYPLLGMTFLRVAQFLKDHPTKIWVIGAANLPTDPPLIVDDKFNTPEFCSPKEARLLELDVAADLPTEILNVIDLDSTNGGKRDIAHDSDETIITILRHHAQRAIKAGEYDAVVYFPLDFAQRLAEFQTRLRNRDNQPDDSEAADEAKIPQPVIFVNKASEKSRIAYNRVDSVLRSWRDTIIKQNLRESRVPVSATQPFNLVDTDVAEEVSRRAAVWSKILPFVVLVWALTGAFYPAVDLCAGEKERGTLETLLSSPAERIEIVWGKLLTIMSFSIATSLLNMVSMGMTGMFIMRQLTQSAGAAAHFHMGPPPLASMGWLVLALIPISALFSALSLAVAAFARSTKEGQYYLMPLLLISLPLMMLPMLPAAELDLGTSLIPITGVMLLLRSLIEGQYAESLRYVVPAVGVTFLCCLLAIRWAVAQFSSESVLFREGERWDLGIWLRHLVRDRADTPTFGEAILCGVLLLVIQFFVTLNVSQLQSFSGMCVVILTSQIALIATPALLMTIMLTRSPRKTLLLTMPRPIALPAAILLAVVLHPCVTLLGHAIEWLYPMSEQTQTSLQPLFEVMRTQPLIYVVLLIGLTPAICEELAFRGFILSGLRHAGNKWTAIVLSSIFFGIAHGLLQQSLAACIVGVVIGYIAVQTGSLFPGILFHLTHNSLAVIASRYDESQNGIAYSWPVVMIAGIIGIAVLFWFRQLPYQPTAEEKLQEAIDHQSAPATAK